MISKIINQRHYPSLNGLRGISIILVVMNHLKLSDTYIYHIIFNGGLGVNIFFVLSGFLITSICIKEKMKNGTVPLREFYIRRILRIFPVAYLYILIIFILNYLYKLDIANIQFIDSIFYSPLNHGILQAATHYFIKFQAISVGCLFSILSFRNGFDNKYFQIIKITGNLIAFFLIFVLKYDAIFSIKEVYINLIISLLTGYIIITNIGSGKDIIYRFLNIRVLSFIGILSYSIYIWQQIFTSSNDKLPKYMVLFPYNLIFIILIPLLSYFLFEKYFLKMKLKFNKLGTT